MIKGSDLARENAPEHAAVIDAFKEQLLIVLLRRLGGSVTLPLSEVDDTGGQLLEMKVDEQGFYLELRRKQ